MSDEIRRTRAGQFVKGQSGNTEGARSRRPKRLLTLTDINRTILEVAGSETKLSIENRLQTISMVERNAWVLASGKGNRLAARDFLDLASRAGLHFERLERLTPRPRPDGDGVQ